uniref:Uncharacterized protein n=1 Tax=Oryza meridionalis TaxID=40149 RepID=A0A0E0CFV0_9ORYZ
MMLLDDTNSSNGSSPDSELCERLSCSRSVMPSHVQQSVPFRHDVERPPSSGRPARNWRRTLFS